MNENIALLADNFELSEVETRLEFGLYSWIGSHCGVTGDPLGGGCTF